MTSEKLGTANRFIEYNMLKTYADSEGKLKKPLTTVNFDSKGKSKKLTTVSFDVSLVFILAAHQQITLHNGEWQVCCVQCVAVRGVVRNPQTTWGWKIKSF